MTSTDRNLLDQPTYIEKLTAAVEQAERNAYSPDKTLRNEPHKTRRCVVEKSWTGRPEDCDATPCGDPAYIYCLTLEDYVCSACHRRELKCLCGANDE